jgi:hypothetical protein
MRQLPERIDVANGRAGTASPFRYASQIRFSDTPLRYASQIRFSDTLLRYASQIRFDRSIDVLNYGSIYALFAPKVVV